MQVMTEQEAIENLEKFLDEYNDELQPLFQRAFEEMVITGGTINADRLLREFIRERVATKPTPSKAWYEPVKD